MTSDPDASIWTGDVKALIQLAALIVTIIGSVTGSAIYLGDKIYTFAEAQIILGERLTTLQGKLEEANAVRDKSFDSLRGDVIPRINKLEEVAHEAAADAAAVRQQAMDMKDDMRQLKELATKNLDLSASHSDDIRATRNAVAPK